MQKQSVIGCFFVSNYRNLWYNTIMALPQKHTILKNMPRRPSLFWDVDPKTVDPKKHARYIIERILEFGTDKEVRWLWLAYSQQLIRDVAQRSRVIHPQTRVLWEALTSPTSR